MLLVEVGRRDPLLVPHQPSQNLFTPRQARHQRWTRSFKQDYSPGSSCWLTWGRPPPKLLCPCWPLQCRMPGLHQDGGSQLYVEVTRAEGVFLLLTTLAGQRVPENTKNCCPFAWTETVFQTFPRLGLGELAVARSSLHSKAGTGIRDRIPVLCPSAGWLGMASVKGQPAMVDS